jgi:hypothetical protein
MLASMSSMQAGLIVSGSLWVIPDADAANTDSAWAKYGSTVADATFEYDLSGGKKIDLNSTRSDDTFGGFLNTGLSPALNVQYNVGASAAGFTLQSGSPLGALGTYGFLIELSGMSYMEDGKSIWAVFHDDGLILNINGATVADQPVGVNYMDGVYSGQTGMVPVQVVYSECCNLPGFLQAVAFFDAPTPNAMPEPTSFALLGGGLLAVYGVRKFRKA